MQLMGRYAAANHDRIHYHIAKSLGLEVMLDIENHHNFAWEEVHNGEKLIVHRKEEQTKTLLELHLFLG